MSENGTTTKFIFWKKIFCSQADYTAKRSDLNTPRGARAGCFVFVVKPAQCVFLWDIYRFFLESSLNI